ncbi:MAG: GNAT family N-acetyltransferase [Lachnospiraceae bacterium]|nr:GNAT family N-acetyltransferase [Lachnospiraceae bacterium]
MEKKKMKHIIIRPLVIEDYDKVHDLWMTIHGFGIRSIDDSKEGVLRFLERNPGISVVAEEAGEIVGSILCGHDGRTGSFYHVCVREDKRRQGIGKAMATACMVALQKEKVNKISLVAFADNRIGNQFWQEEGWTERVDYNCYDFYLNAENITKFNQ